VWVSVSYLHNGSVPNVWEVLKPADRKPLWRRKSKSPRSDQVGRVVMGFDTSMSAYDTAKLGWKYDVIRCQKSIGRTSCRSAIASDNNVLGRVPAQATVPGLLHIRRSIRASRSMRQVMSSPRPRHGGQTAERNRLRLVPTK
jgi:hypothetical protein